MVLQHTYFFHHAAEGQNVVISGASDLTDLGRFKNILLALQTEFGGIVVDPTKRDEFNRRLILLENEIDGLMKRKINYSIRDGEGGSRFLDYTSLLNEKENQIIELEKKINNLEERLRRAGQRELELENHIVALTADLRRKDEIVRFKNEQLLAEVAASNLFREAWLKVKQRIEQNRTQLGGLANTLLDGINLPEVDIRPDALAGQGSRSTAYQGQSQGEKYKTQLVALFREFERLNNSPNGVTDADFERVMEGFLTSIPNSRFKEITTQMIERKKIEDNYNKLKKSFGVAGGLFRAALDRLKQSNPSLRIDIDRELFEYLQRENVNVERIDNGTAYIEVYKEKTVEVPVQDARTKHLLHLLAVQLKKLSSKYPKVLAEMDVRLT